MTKAAADTPWMPDMAHAAAQLFLAEYQYPPTVIGVAPGRVELLGNHTDHNLGLVMSAAIDRHTWVAAAANGSNAIRVRSRSTSSADAFTLPDVTPLPRGAWSNYVRGAVAGLISAGVPVRGLDAAITSDLPLGGGLSSSASLECAVAMAVLGLFESETVDLAGMALAELLQQFEQRVVGVQCGILDQFSSVLGRAGHALFLDCDTLDHDAVALGADPPAIVVCDSGVPRELATGKYNERRSECEAALESIRTLCGSARFATLSQVPEQEFQAHEAELEPVLSRRARHVITENRRVRAGFELLKSSGDVRAFGQLMLRSHRSSRDDFENSSAELDSLVEIAATLPGYLGAKLSGAGWGGCTVNLVERSHAEEFSKRLVAEQSRRFSTMPKILICQPAAGARFHRI